MKNGAEEGKCMYFELISGSDLICGVMDGLLEEMTHNFGQKDGKELSRSEEAMTPTERNSAKCKGLKVQMSMKSHLNEGERRDDRDESGKGLIRAKPTSSSQDTKVVG